MTMKRVPRWLRNDPIEPERRPSSFSVDSDARRYNRRHVQANHDQETEYSITVNLGGFGAVGVPWGGTSVDDARDSFLEFLYNHDEFGIHQREPHKYFRSLYVNFKGNRMLLTFRTSWITGFTIG